MSGDVLPAAWLVAVCAVVAAAGLCASALQPKGGDPRADA